MSHVVYQTRPHAGESAGRVAEAAMLYAAIVRSIDADHAGWSWPAESRAVAVVFWSDARDELRRREGLGPAAVAA